MHEAAALIEFPCLEMNLCTKQVRYCVYVNTGLNHLLPSFLVDRRRVNLVARAHYFGQDYIGLAQLLC